MWHDDMHPSSFDSTLYSDGGPGSVLLGDRIVWKVYQAIRNSKSATGNNWQNTLLIITFDEHGGGFDHIPPPAATSPDPSQFNNNGVGQCGFDFKRLRGSTKLLAEGIRNGCVGRKSVVVRVKNKHAPRCYGCA